jgi:hypothetical protein
MPITAKGLVSFLSPANVSAPTQFEQDIIRLFNQLFPELQGDLFSFIQNSGCSCKQRLIDTLNRNPEQAELLVKEIYKESPPGRPIPEFAISTEDVTDPTTVTSAAGKVITIPADNEEYRKLLRKMYADRQVYQGIFMKFEPKTWTLYFY